MVAAIAAAMPLSPMVLAAFFPEVADFFFRQMARLY